MNASHEEEACAVPVGTADSRFVLKGTRPAYAPSRAFDTEHIRLELDVDMARQTLNGRAVTTLRAIRREAQTLAFDAVNMKILGVRLDGKTVSYTHEKDQVLLTLKSPISEGRRIQVQIDYRVVRPVLGMFFIKPDKHYPKRPRQVWTQGEDEYARYWFPCFDAPHERTTTEVIATVPRGFVAVSNGRLLRSAHNLRRKTSTYHWKQEIPHATYLVTLTVGRFSLIKDKWRDVPVLYYCEKGREAEALRAFSKTPKMLEFFSKSIGVKYPYPKYAQIAAHDFIFGGMENTSATTQTEYALLDERAALDYTSDELVAHELAHQWFGDYLTCNDWAHAWLNESFATYFDALFKRHDKGEDEFLYVIRNNSREYLSEDKERYRRSIATGTFRRPSDLFDRHLYEKGSVVLFMLHRILGERLFWKAIGTYVRDNRGRTVETNDLINAVEKATGYNMRRFFDQWVFGPGHPEFTVTFWWDERKKEINLRVVQTQGNGAGLFTVETEFLFATKRGERREKVAIDGKAHLFKFKLESEPEMVLFDPDHRVLKTVSFAKPENWLLRQLAKDKNVLGRIEAAHELSRRNSPVVLEALKKSLLNDPFWGVRAESARAIGSLNTDEAATALLHCLDVAEHPKVRRAIYEALRMSRRRGVADEIEKRFRKEPSYFVEAEGLRVLAGLRHPRAKVAIEETLKKDSWNDVLRQAAVESMAITRSETWIPTILSYTRPGHHQRLRLVALRSLMSFRPASEAVKKRLLELTADPFLLVQNTAVRALQELGDERAVPVLKKLTTGHRDGRLKRIAEEAINKLTKGFE